MCLCWKKNFDILIFTPLFFYYFMVETICQLLIIIVIKNQFNIKIPTSGGENNINKNFKRFSSLLFLLPWKMSVFIKQCQNLNNLESSKKTFNSREL